MRADRLIAELMLLQSRGRMTARELAREVEVTERTIYRDIESLSFSGVPVYTERGPGGGISLLESYRTTLTGMTRGEVRALFTLSIPAALDELGLDAEARTAFLKLSAALPGTLREEEQRTRQRFYIDQSGWQATRGPKSQSAIIQQAVWEDRLLEVRYRSILEERIAPLEAILEPYSLVAWRGEWHLVSRQKEIMRVMRLERILEAELLPGRFQRLPDFDLALFWKKWVSENAAHPYPFSVQALVAPEALPYLTEYREDFDAIQSCDIEDGIRLHTRLNFKNLEQARDRLLALGGSVEVLKPLALRLSIGDFAREIAAVYRGGDDDRSEFTIKSNNQ